jgi:hypothetical protein
VSSGSKVQPARLIVDPDTDAGSRLPSGSAIWVVMVRQPSPVYPDEMFRSIA